MDGTRVEPLGNPPQLKDKLLPFLVYFIQKRKFFAIPQFYIFLSIFNGHVPDTILINLKKFNCSSNYYSYDSFLTIYLLLNINEYIQNDTFISNLLCILHFKVEEIMFAPIAFDQHFLSRHKVRTFSMKTFFL